MSFYFIENIDLTIFLNEKETIEIYLGLNQSPLSKKNPQAIVYN